MPDKFDDLWAGSGTTGGATQVAQAPSGDDGADFDKLWNGGAQTPKMAPVGQELTPKLDPSAPNAVAPAAPKMQEGALDYGKLGSDLERGGMAGIAMAADLGGALLPTKQIENALGIHHPAQPTYLEQFQKATGQPNYPLAYNAAKGIPLGLMFPEFAPGVGGLAGIGLNVMAPNALAGGAIEAGEQASQHKPLDPVAIGTQAAISAVAAVPIHGLLQGILHPMRAAQAIGKALGFGGKEAEQSATAANPDDIYSEYRDQMQREATGQPVTGFDKEQDLYAQQLLDEMKRPEIQEQPQQHQPLTPGQPLEGGLKAQPDLNALFADETEAAQRAKGGTLDPLAYDAAPEAGKIVVTKAAFGNDYKGAPRGENSKGYTLGDLASDADLQERLDFLNNERQRPSLSPYQKGEITKEIKLIGHEKYRRAVAANRKGASLAGLSDADLTDIYIRNHGTGKEAEAALRELERREAIKGNSGSNEPQRGSVEQTVPTTDNAGGGTGGAGGGDSEGGAGDGGGSQPPDRIPTVREEAVGLRERTGVRQATPVEQQALAPMLQKKLERDQAEHNFRKVFGEIEKKLGEGMQKPSRMKHQVLTPEEEAIRDMARDYAGLRPDQLKRNPDTSEISTIRHTDEKSAPLVPYQPKGKNLTQLVGEAKFYQQQTNKLQKEYEQIRDGLNLQDSIEPHGSVEALHKGRRFVIKHSRQPKRSEQGLGYQPQGTPEQNNAYAGALTQMRDAAMRRKGELNQELVPDMDQLAENLEAQGDSELATIVRGRKAIEGDDRIIQQAAKEGMLEDWQQFWKELLDGDNRMRQALGVGMVVGGQMLNPTEAEAATPEERRKQKHAERREQQASDLRDVGTALTLAGAAVVLGPKVAKTKPFSMAATAMANLTDVVLFSNLKRALNFAEKNAPGFLRKPGLIQGLTLTKSNMDIIRGQNPKLGTDLDRQIVEWWKAVSGKGLIPDTAAALQEWTDAPYMSGQEFVDMIHNSTNLSPQQKTALANLRSVMDQGHKMLAGEIERVQQAGNPADKGYLNTLRMEDEMNWNRGGWRAGQRSSVFALTARAATEAAQRGNLKLHAYHYLEMLYSVPARAGVEHFAEAQRLMATADKQAKHFVESLGMRLPVHGNFEDTRNPLGDALAKTAEKVANAIPGLKQLSTSPVVAGGKKAISGQLAEEVKMSTALIAFSEKAANDMNYAGGGKQLRHDVSAWLNGKTHQTSSHFTEDKGFEALGRIMGDVDHTVGGSPAGYRVALTTDRLAYQNDVWRNALPFTRTRIIAARARANMLQEAADATGRGDFDTARKMAKGAFIMTGLSCAWLGGAAMDKEIYGWLLEHDPAAAKRYHDSMQKFAILGRTPGAVGGILQNAGVENDLSKYNFVAPHTQPGLFWPANVGQSTLGQAVSAAKTAANPKKSAEQRTSAAIRLAAQVGISGIPELVSFEVLDSLNKRYQHAAKQGGTVEYTYSPSGFAGLGDVLTDHKGQTADLGPFKLSHSEYVNSHFKEESPIEAMVTHYLTPGESMGTEADNFHDLVEYNSAKILKDRYPDSYKTLEKMFKHMTPTSQVYEHIRTSIAHNSKAAKAWAEQEKQPGHKPTPKERADNLPEKYGNIEDEMNKPVQWGNLQVKPAEFWRTMLEESQKHPEWIKSLGRQS